MGTDYAQLSICVHCGNRLNYSDPYKPLSWDGIFCNKKCREDFFQAKKDIQKKLDAILEELKKFNVEDIGITITNC